MVECDGGPYEVQALFGEDSLSTALPSPMRPFQTAPLQAIPLYSRLCLILVR